MRDQVGTVLLLIAVLTQAAGCFLAWDWGRAARDIERHVRTRIEPQPPTGWQPRHRLSGLSAPTLRLPVIGGDGR